MDVATEAILNKLKDSLRSHRQVDAVRALRELIHQGIANYNDGADPIGDKRDARVSLRSCVDIVRAIDELIPPKFNPEHDSLPFDIEDAFVNPKDDSTPDTEYVLCIWPGVAGERAQSYRYFDYKEAMEDAERHLHDASFGPDVIISVSKVLAVSKVTRTMARV